MTRILLINLPLFDWIGDKRKQNIEAAVFIQTFVENWLDINRWTCILAIQVKLAKEWANGIRSVISFYEGH